MSNNNGNKKGIVYWKRSIIWMVIVMFLIITNIWIINTWFIPKIAYVDSGSLLVGFSEANKAKREIKNVDEKWKKEFQALKDSLQAAVDMMSKEFDNASDKRKKELQDILSSRNQRIDNFKQAHRRKMQSLNQDKMSGVVSKINVYVKEYGKKHGYDIILGANESGNVVYANKDVYDITDEIIEGLNKRYK